MTSTVQRYDFDQHLRQSAKHAADPFWGEVYRKAFPDFYNRIIVTELNLQHQGIDSVIQLKSGGKINVDEKVREPKDKRGWAITPQSHGILLEEWSSVRERKNGWWRADKSTDYLAYAFLATQECFLLPFQALRRTRVEYGEEWMAAARQKRNGFQQINSASKRGSVEWETFSISVPIKVLKSALSNVMDIQWGEPRAARMPDFLHRTCVYPVGNTYCLHPIPDGATSRLCEDHSISPPVSDGSAAPVDAAFLSASALSSQ